MTTHSATAGRIGAGASSRPGDLLEPLRRLFARWQEHRRIARTMAELDLLSDRELADIGLTRSDIESAARGSVRGRL